MGFVVCLCVFHVLFGSLLMCFYVLAIMFAITLVCLYHALSSAMMCVEHVCLSTICLLYFVFLLHHVLLSLYHVLLRCYVFALLCLLISHALGVFLDVLAVCLDWYLFVLCAFQMGL